MKKCEITIEIIYDETVYDSPEVWNYNGLLDAETKLISATSPVDIELQQQLHKVFRDDSKYKRKDT